MEGNEFRVNSILQIWKVDRMEQTLEFWQGAMLPHCYADANLSQLILLL